MDGNKTISAIFTKDIADTDGDGFSNYDELVVHDTDPTDVNGYPTRILSVDVALGGNIVSSGEVNMLGNLVKGLLLAITYLIVSIFI